MNFVEVRFLLFFLIVFSVHWSLRRNTARKVWLLAVSYVFYGAWDWRFLGLILTSTILDSITGIKIHASDKRNVRRAWLGLSLLGNLGMLAFFKYYNFFVTGGVEVLDLIGISASAPTLAIILPVGISFYTFQTLSYSLDIYFRKLEPAESHLDLATFVAFFPQLVAGPIVRALEFLPQLRVRRYWKDVRVRFALTTFLIGFIKKAVVADSLSIYIDPIFADPGAYDTASVWLGMCLFHVQLYADFSGYSDMAIGTAALLGYSLPMNFGFPYFTTSMTIFWQRWHMTLGRWLTDYVYIPLGGSRGSQRRTCINIVILFTTCGLWHGAGWNFLVWGSLNGVVLVVERLGLRSWLGKRPDLVQRAYVLAMWFVTLAFFRSATFGQAMEYLGRMTLLTSAREGGEILHLANGWWAAAVGFMICHWLTYRGALKRLERLPDWGYALVFGGVAALMLPWVATNAAPFIYFQF